MYVRARSTWTAHPNVALEYVDWKGERRPVRVHHTASAGPTTRWTVAQEKAHLRALEANAIASGEYRAIPYSYIVFPSGRVYEGRGFEKLGGHTRDHNEDIGVAFAGNYETQRLSKAAKQGFIDLRENLAKRGARASRNRLHRETYNTLCPGRHVVSEFKKPNLGL